MYAGETEGLADEASGSSAQGQVDRIIKQKRHHPYVGPGRIPQATTSLGNGETVPSCQG